MNPIYLLPYTLPMGEKRPAYEHLLGRQLLIRALSERLGLEVSLDWLEEHIRPKKNGKPFISGLPHVHYNISHCEGMVALALAGSPVGLDVERVRPLREPLARRVLTKDELACLFSPGTCEAARRELFTRFWTLKESYLKYTGDGIAVPLTSVSFRFLEAAPGNEGLGAYAIACSDPSVSIFQRDLPGGLILSACAAAGEPFSADSLIFLAAANQPAGGRTK